MISVAKDLMQSKDRRYTELISREDASAISDKNRELRIQVKSLLKEDTDGMTGCLKKSVGDSSKRILVKQKDYLLLQNDQLFY